MSTCQHCDTCQHCGRVIELVGGLWIDPLATDDDEVWRETCDEHDTFVAEHEPTVRFVA
jgi:tRNA G26 N,N-dimethylase Trm1